jgi:hypothetical protein
VRLDVIDSGIGLGAVSEGHGGKVLVVSLAVGIQDGVGLPLSDGAVALHQVEFLQVSSIVCKGLAKNPELDPRSKIEASQHVKHDPPPLEM